MRLRRKGKLNRKKIQTRQITFLLAFAVVGVLRGWSLKSAKGMLSHRPDIYQFRYFVTLAT